MLFLAKSPPAWVRGAAAGAGAAVPAVAISAAVALMPASWRRAGPVSTARARWICYLLAGGVAANLAGEFLVAVLLACGLAEWLASRSSPSAKARATGGPGAAEQAGQSETGPDGGDGSGRASGRIGGLLLPLAAGGAVTGWRVRLACLGRD